MDWINIFNRLFELIDTQGGANYFQARGSFGAVRHIDPYHADYYQLIEQRRKEQKSTTRRGYFYDVLMSFPESERIGIVTKILDELDGTAAERAGHIRAMFTGSVPGPSATVPSHGWNAERLNRYLAEIDQSLATANEERAVTLGHALY